MPDLERWTRRIHIQMLEDADPTMVEARMMENYYKGIDFARKQIAILFGICVGVGCVIYIATV